jgi:hypothetical protein
MAQETPKVIPFFPLRPQEESYLYGSTILKAFDELRKQGFGKATPLDQDGRQVVPSSFYKVSRWGFWRIE